MAKRDVDLARLSTANTHLNSAERSRDAAKRAEARGAAQVAEKLRKNAEFSENLAGRALDAAYNSVIGKKR